MVTVLLDGPAGPENVGILMADQRGLFRRSGLHVRVISPGNPKGVVPSLADRKSFGIAQQPQIIIDREEGAQIVGFGAVIPEATEAMIWLKGSGLDRLADLKGKTIAYPGLPYQRSLLKSGLARVGLTLGDVQLKPVGYELVSTLEKGEADAIFGGSWNLEGADLRSRGMNPVIKKVQGFGTPNFDELMVVAPFRCVYGDPGLMRDFLDAVKRGNRVAARNPADAAQVIEENDESDPSISSTALRAELRETLPLLSKSGFVNLNRQPLLGWMKQQGLIQGKWPFATMFTNYYL